MHYFSRCSMPWQLAPLLQMLSLCFGSCYLVVPVRYTTQFFVSIACSSYPDRYPSAANVDCMDVDMFRTSSSFTFYDGSSSMI
jgi:hypothetical protein